MLKSNELAQVSRIKRELAKAKTPPQVIDLEAKLSSIESYMKKTGLYRTEEIREVNEAKMRARWRLGQLLSEIERSAGPGRGKKIGSPSQSFTGQLKNWNLESRIATLAQRIGTLPEADLERIFAVNREADVLTTYEELVDEARSYWYQASRKKKHRDIASKSRQAEQTLGPFPLLYADPPWKFETYSEKGLERTPDQHYPTLSDEEIIDFKIDGKTVPELAAKDATLFLWCTSSNIVRALAVMEAWGFTYKTHAVWDKVRSGTGLVFRNQHEVILYGTRGAMPGPQHQPKSVFRFQRGRHSAKPPEIRKAIERMYPDFDQATRLELFARDQIEGWTCRGFEALDHAAE